MQKVVRILEGNVEWIALGLGVAFLCFMGWTYLLNPPVVAVLNGERLTPGNVDDYIFNGPVQNLKQRMTDPPIPKFDVQDFSDVVRKRLDPPPSTEPTFASIWDNQPAQI